MCYDIQQCTANHPQLATMNVCVCTCATLHVSVCAVEDALSVMRKGTENRRIGETNMNRESSRSHSVFTCIMESSSKGAEDGCTRVKFSRLNLVDLAGTVA